MRPIFVQVCLFDMECLQHACSRQAEGGFARTAPHLFFGDRVDIVDAAVNDRIATDRVLHHWVDAVCRRHDPASADERGGARMLPASGHPKTAQVRESSWIALHFVAHRIRIFPIATVRQGQGLSDMVTDERVVRAASSEVWIAANSTVDRRSCRQRRYLGRRITDSAQTATSTAEALRTPKPFWPNAKASQANGVEAWMPRNHDAESILMASCEGFRLPILLRSCYVDLANRSPFWNGGESPLDLQLQPQERKSDALDDPRGRDSFVRIRLAERTRIHRLHCGDPPSNVTYGPDVYGSGSQSVWQINERELLCFRTFTLGAASLLCARA